MKKQPRRFAARFAENQPTMPEEKSVIRLSKSGARKIISLLDHPPKPNQRLKDAVELARKNLFQATCSKSGF